MLLHTGDVKVLLSPLGRRPFRRHGAFLEHFLLVLREMLLRSRNLHGVDDLPSPGDEPLIEQLTADAIETGLGAGLPKLVLECPHHDLVWNVGRLIQFAGSVYQLVFHLFVR